MQIGERIRCLRISKGLTQYDLAQAMKCYNKVVTEVANKI